MDNAASVDPYFAMIGGDITYDNGFPACYYRWDQWFDNWNKRMVTRDGYSIPIIASIGNHEAGGFFSNTGNDPYYSAYFPQQTGINLISPRSRSTYHSHQLNKNASIFVLDSDIVTRMDSQVGWLEDEMRKYANTPIKISLYHGNLYPAVPDSGDSSIEQQGKQYWTPIFEKYNLTTSFENHCHAYKRTFPLRADKVADDGVVYFGDGAWGVDPREPSKSWYTEVVAKKQHFFHVRIDNNTITVDAIDAGMKVFDTWRKDLTTY